MLENHFSTGGQDFHKRHMQFMTSAPNFMGLADPPDPAFPSPWQSANRS